MRNTGLVFDRRFLEHDTGPSHPERPERLAVLERLFGEPRYADLPRIDARAADEDELARVHRAAHLRAVAASAERETTYFDADTAASAGSFQAARLAAGAAIDLADAVLDGRVDNGFAALRPPGHHAEADRPMGFCLFNNVAVVAQHLRQRRGLERVLVLDWDVHHGNGTQHSFYDDPSVLYASLHQYPFYPGTGAAEELGAGDGEGFTVNVPMPAGAVDDDYLAAFRDVVVPVAERFNPEFVLVSAGFDAHANDPLASVSLTTAAFAAMADAMTDLADRTAAGRIVLLLEGGYDLAALGESVDTVLDRLLDPQPVTTASGDLGAGAARARALLQAHWGRL